MARQRNEGGRFSTGSDWYREIEEEHIRRIEAEWTAKAAQEEAAYLAPLYAAWERQPRDEDYDGEDHGDLVDYDRAA
jgi:hypothetical protein